MRIALKTIMAAFLAAACAAPVLAATTLNVYVKDQAGNPVGDVMVAAIEFGMNGPSTNTKVGLTSNAPDATKGKVQFSLADNKSFSIYVSSYGYSPSISDQFNNPEYSPDRYIWADGTVRYSTFTLTSGLTEVARIRLEIANATPNTVLFGGIYNMLAQQQGGTGIIQTDGGGNGFLIVDNVPFAAANTYNIGVYDPYLNRGTGRNIMTALGDNLPLESGARTLSYTGLAARADFNNSIPPSRVDNNSNSAAAAGTTLDGIVRSTAVPGEPWSPIPHVGVNFRSCNGGLWTNVDENGRFKLSNLTVGATYYAESMGGCAWSNNGNGSCYEPYSSPALSGVQDLCSGLAPMGANDFVYTSSAVAQPVLQNGVYTETIRVELNQIAESTGSFKVCVRAPGGMVIPNSNVNVNPDGSPWGKAADSCQYDNNSSKYDFLPGFAMKNFSTDATGCATVTGLPTGNYTVNVWTPFSGGNSVPFNAGPDGQSTVWGNNVSPCTDQTCWLQAHCRGNGVDDYRVYVETNTTLGDGQMMHIFNSSGTPMEYAPSKYVSSITYIVQTGGNSSGVVWGSLKFPGPTDLSKNPVVITLYGQCQEGVQCPAGNFTFVNGSGAAQYTYSINVSSGFSYSMNINSVGWGRLRRGGGDDSIHLESSSSTVVNMEFSAAGTVLGTVYKPDGTVFTAANNQYVWVDAGNDNGWAGVQLQKDGTFLLPNVLPGINRISLNVSGGDSSGVNTFNYALPSPQPTVTVIAGSTSTVNLNLVAANYVGIGLDVAKVPDNSVMKSPGDSYDSILGFKVMPIPAGTVITGETVSSLLFAKGSDQSELRYSTGTAVNEEGPCGRDWAGGFCAASIPSPAVYDFYLMRSGDFGNMSKGGVPNMPYPHFVLLTSSRNVVVDNAHATALVQPAYTMSKSSGVYVEMTPATDMSGRGNATLFGAVTARNFFRQADYDSLGGDFDKFVEYLPVVTLYDSNGAFSAAGIVVPPPAFIAQKEMTGEFNGAFAKGFPEFKALLSQAASFNFEIRGLPPSTCYTAVITTPNYPHYQTRACTGVNKTTATLNIDLDSAVGAGATIVGVVKSSAATPAVLANASVELTMEGSEKRTAVTNAAGAFRFEGLSGGIAKINVSAPGYATMMIEEAVSGSNSYTENVFLYSAPGSIAGTVYSQKLPFAKVQAGAKIVAYDDTYNGGHPTMPLPLLKTMTGADGTYTLDGLIPGHVYKVFLKVTGKYTLNVATQAVNGVLSGVDFTMLPKPLDIEIFGKKNLQKGVYEFTMVNPQDFKQGEAKWSQYPYGTGSVKVLNLEQLAGGELHGSIPLSDLVNDITYVLRGSATSYANKNVTKEMLFGKNYDGNADQHIDDIMLGDDSDDGTGRKNNEAAVDKTGADPSALVLPAGALIASTASAVVPTCSFKAEDKNSLSVSTKVAAVSGAEVAGNLYTVSLSSVAQTDRSIELTLAYDKSITDASTLNVAQYNNSTGKWDSVPGLATVNPVKGTVTVKLKKLASVLSKNSYGPQAVFDGRQYSVRPQAAGSGTTTTGTFAVLNYVGDNLPAGSSKLKVFNYPNPFNLKTKNMANNHNAAAMPATTFGTMIHVEVPAANGGPCHIRIYTLAGELVKDISETCTGGKYNYFGWDGKNKGGQEVANGVYYGVVELSGPDPDRKDATFKMAVIK